MVDEQYNAVLIDFGLSRSRFDVTRSLSDVREAGVVRYLAPELLRGEDKFRTSERSDTYSLGMVIYNFLYDLDPFSDLRNDHAVLFAVTSGKSPRREKLPAHRLSPAWHTVEEKLWPVLESVWVEETKRATLDIVHTTVRYLAFLKADDLSESLDC